MDITVMIELWRAASPPQDSILPCMDKKRMTEVVARLGRATIGCVGDVMLDHFVYGNVHRISPEAPVPVLHVERQHSMLGAQAMRCAI